MPTYLPGRYHRKTRFSTRLDRRYWGFKSLFIFIGWYPATSASDASLNMGQDEKELGPYR